MARSFGLDVLGAEVRKRAGELSVEGYLEKPFTFLELREAVDAVLRQRERAE